jgi:hypothetical protein
VSLDTSTYCGEVIHDGDKDVVIMGGGSVASESPRAGLVDVLSIHLAPVVLLHLLLGVLARRPAFTQHRDASRGQHRDLRLARTGRGRGSGLHDGRRRTGAGRGTPEGRGALQRPLPETKRFETGELLAPSLFRLYRATATEHSVLIRGGDPKYGRGADSRLTLSDI